MKISQKDFVFSSELIPGGPYEQYKVKLKHTPTGIHTIGISGHYDNAGGGRKLRWKCFCVKLDTLVQLR